MSGPIFQRERISAHLVESGEAYVLVSDEASEDEIRDGLTEIKNLGFRDMTSIYFDETLDVEVMVFTR